MKKKKLYLYTFLTITVSIFLYFLFGRHEINHSEQKKIDKMDHLTSSQWKKTSFDSLVAKSPKFFIFYSQNDCDFCVHQLIWQANHCLDSQSACVIAICSDIRLLQFCKKNYETNFDFFSICPDDINWIKKEPTPFIAYISKDLEVKEMQTYNPKDTNQLRLFIDRYNKN